MVITPDHDNPGEKKARAQAAQLVQLVEDEEIEFFHNPEGEPFARAPSGETWGMSSSAFKRWLAGALYRTGTTVPREAAIKDAIAVMAAKAIYEGPELAVFVRVGRRGGTMYLDVGDPTWRAVEVTAKGWRVVEAADVPVRFRRPPGMLLLPEPERGGRLDELRPLLNLPDEEAWSLVAGYLVAALALVPAGPFPILALRGEQGSAKSTASEHCANLIDPRTAGLRALPHSLENLAVAAHNGHLLGFDNISHIEPLLSDGLCRLATGAGFATRALYTNGEEAIFAGARPVILNGIGDAAVRGDLVDRLVTVELPRITKGRITKREALKRFAAARPRVLAGLLDAVVLALRDRDVVRIADLPRMADFVIVAVAAEPAMGVPPGTFSRAYGVACDQGSEIVLEADITGGALRVFIENHRTWEGSAGQLLDVLPAPHTNTRGWPASPTAMGNALRRLAPAFRRVGIEVTNLPRTGRTGRRWRLTVTTSVTGQPSPDTLNKNKGSDTGDAGDTRPRSSFLPCVIRPEELWPAEENVEARRQALKGEW